MMKYVKQTLTIFLSIIMLSSVPFTAFAQNDIDSVELGDIYQSEIAESESTLQSGNPDEPVLGGEELLPQDGLSGIIEGDVDGGDAPPEGDEIVPDNGLSNRMGDDASISAAFESITEDQIIYEGEVTEEISFAGLQSENDNIALLMAAPSLSVNPSSDVIVIKGSSTTVTVSFSNYSQTCFLQYATSNDSIIGASWGNWSNGNSIPLTINGKINGNVKILVRLISSSTKQIVTSTTINVYVCSPTLTVSATSLSLEKGKSFTLTVKPGNYNGAAYLSFGSTNNSAFSGQWGSYSSYLGGYPLTVNGLKKGSGTLIVYFYTSSGFELCKKTVRVNVTDETPKITLSASTAKVSVGGTTTINVGYTGYSGQAYLQFGTTGDSFFKTKWGTWNGSSAPLNLSGLSAGSGRVTIYLKRYSDNYTLASASINPVTVSFDDNPSLSISTDKVSIKAGNSTTIKATASGVTGSYYFNYYIPDSNAFSCSWGKLSNGTAPLTITGKSSGEGTIVVRLYRTSGDLLKIALVSVSVIQQGTPTLSTSPKSINMESNSTELIKITYGNTDVPVSFSASYSGSDYYSCSWGEWTGNTVYLYVSGKSSGNGVITINLKNKNTGAILKTAQVNVSVVAATVSNINNIGYWFTNYSQDWIPRKLCKFIFGDTERAEQVYLSNLGHGGVCFGFSTTAALIYHQANGMRISNYRGGLNRTSQLYPTTLNTTSQLSASELIEAMQVSQVALPRTWGENNVALTLKRELDLKHLVEISIRGQVNGQQAGHAILAYGYEETPSGITVYVYDCNKGLEAQRLYLTKDNNIYNGWSYAPLNWGSGKPGANIGCLTISAINNLWSRKGYSASLMSLMGADEPIDHDALSNFLITSENNFDLSFRNYDTGDIDLMLRYENGYISYQNPDYNIEERPLMSMDTDSQTHFVLIPSEFTYYIKDTSSDKDGFKATLVNINLSTTIDTDANEFSIYANDEENMAYAMLMDAETGDSYSISIGSTMGDERQEIRADGFMDGIADSIGLTLNEGVPEVTGSGGSVQSLSLTTDSQYYTVHTQSSEGGTISPNGTTEYQEGEICEYYFTPHDGYVLSSLIINGEDTPIEAGSWKMEFQSGMDTLYSVVAEFKKDISTCHVELLSDGSSVKVVDPDGIELINGVDYYISVAEESESEDARIYIVSEKGGRYSGSIEYSISPANNSISNTFYNKETRIITVDLQNRDGGLIIIGFYDKYGRNVAIKMQEIGKDDQSISIDCSDVIITNPLSYKVFFTNNSFIPLTSAYEG